MPQSSSRRVHSSAGKVSALAFIALLCLGFASQAGAMAPPATIPMAAPGSLDRGVTQIRSSAEAPVAPALSAKPEDVGGDVIPNHYIVVLEDSVRHPAAVADEQADEVDGEVNLVYRAGLKGYAATMSKADAAALRGEPNVRYVVPDRKVEVSAQATPAGIERTAAPKNASLAIDGKENVEVDADIAIIDTGIDFEDPDLRVVSRTDCVPPGEDFVAEYAYKECADGSGSDKYGHGTHVAGTAAALDNGTGVVGVAPGARLWAVRVLNRQGVGTESWIAAGIDWVTAHAEQIEVANMSLGCQCSMPAVEDAIEASAEAGVLYTLSAGNNAANAGESSPAKNPDAITVSALAISDKNPGGQEPGTCFLNDPSAENKLASFSNYGTVVDVAAPGTCIYSTLPDGEYWWLHGTSMAAPHVAGAAAILASKENPEDLGDVEAIRQKIEEEGSSAWEDTSGDGVKEPLLNVEDSTAFAAKGHPVTQPATIASKSEAMLRGLVNPEGKATEYRFEYGTTTAYGTSVPASGEAIGSGTEYVAVSETLKGLSGQTPYHYRVVATSSAGTTYGEDRTFGTTAPTVSIETPEAHGSDAVLKAAINPEGLPTTYRFEYGTTTAYTYRAPLAPQSLGSGTSTVKVSEAIGQLTGSKTYHYRIVVTNPAGTTVSSDQTFSTPAAEWTTQSTPSVISGSYLWDTSCSSQNDCMAVGHEHLTPPGSLLAEHWDGKEWLKTSMPDPENAGTEEMTGVSCTGSSWCVATGWYQDGAQVKSVLERWDGAKWSIMWAPSTGAALLKLFSVSCISANTCMAVGFERLQSGGPVHTAAAVWDGEGWSMEAPPEPIGAAWSDLESVSCSSPPSCVAVGAYGEDGGNSKPYAVQWDGGAWTIIQDAAPAELPPGTEYYLDLRSVTCWQADACAAVVRGGSTVQRWDGKTWTAEAIPEPIGGAEGGFDVNIEIDCSHSTSCVTAGFYREYFRSYRMGGELWAPRVTRYDGSGWSLRPVANPTHEEEPNGSAAKLLGLDCPSVSACVAVGEQYSQSKGRRPLIETYHAPGPTSETLPASGVLSDSATLKARINPNGVATTYQFEYGETSEYGSKVPASPKSAGSGSTAVELSEALKGLKADTTYHFRVTATNSKGTTYGEDRTFSTIAVPLFRSAFGEYGTEAPKLNEPLGIALDSAGNVWVADSGNDRIEKFSPSGELLLQFGSSGTTEAHFDQPYGLAVDSAGNVWVADAWNNRIQEFNAKGEFIKAIGWGIDDGTTKAFQTCTSTCFQGISGSGSGQFYRPYALTFDSKGNLWVADTWNDRIQEFNAKGEYLAQLAVGGYDIAVDASGNLWLPRIGEDKVVEYDSTGKELLHIGSSKGSGPGEFNAPTGIGIDADGNIWVADSENNRVQEFSPAGGYLTQIGEAGTGDGQLDFPRDVAFDSSGNIWLADSYNSRVQRWSYSPSATTGAATNVKGTNATLNATIDPEGIDTSYYFEYGATASYGMKAPIFAQPIGSGEEAVAVSEAISGLSGNTVYHYRVVAVSPTRKIYGADATLTTLKAPKATTEAATAVKATQATFNGTVNPEGLSTSYWFEYGPTASYGIKSTPISAGAGTADVVVSRTVSLSEGSTYHYRIVAGNENGTTYGADVSLTTLKVPQTTTEAATSVKATQATLNATVNPEGFATSYWFEYGTTAKYGTKIPVSPASIGSGTSWVPVSQTPTGLAQGTTYHYRVVAENAAAKIIGFDKTLTTLKLPKTTTEAATNLTDAEATLNGTVNPEGSATGYWFEYGPTTSYGTKIPTTAKEAGSGTSNVAVSQTPTGLSAGATYHFRLVAESAAGTSNGEDKTLTTPTWTLQSTTNPSANVALGDVSCTSASECIAVGSSGSASLAERWNGSEWSTMTSPGGGGMLSDVSCGATTFCLAIPTGGLNVQRWNGSEWTTLTAATPVGGTTPSLNGVSCTSSSACMAVGTYNVSGGSRTLAERWNGSEWTILTTPFEEGAFFNTLEAVSCTSSNSCTAVGLKGGKRTSMRWNGSEWSVLATLKEASGGSADISCTAVDACIVALGGSSKVERWDGTEWSVATVPTPEGGSFPKVSGVSCALASDCIVVGKYTKESKTVTLAESWNGSSWSVQATPNNSEFGGALEGISCTSSTQCTAAGSYKPKKGESRTLAIRYE